MQNEPKNAPWKLKSRDFSKRKIHAPQDWRFQMLFEYLRISPSYALANECKNESELADKLGDRDWAARVWKTYTDIGNVDEVLYRDWWLRNGLKLFGIETAKPKSEKVSRLDHDNSTANVSLASAKDLESYINGNYSQQGQPDSLLVSIPLGQKRTVIMRQLKRLLDEAVQAPIYIPQPLYPLETNKMRYRRLLAGLRLVTMQAARPDDALWRVATRAKISINHGKLDPNATKRDAKGADSRRLLTIMASRLMRDTLTIAENAAQGLFPSMAPTSVKTFDFVELQQRIKKINAWDKQGKLNYPAI